MKITRSHLKALRVAHELVANAFGADTPNARDIAEMYATCRQSMLNKAARAVDHAADAVDRAEYKAHVARVELDRIRGMVDELGS